MADSTGEVSVRGSARGLPEGEAQRPRPASTATGQSPRREGPALSARTWLLGGIPRSGTSLCCRLAGELPDTVALSEPFTAGSLGGGMPRDPGGACIRIARFVEETRERILGDGRAPSVQVEGRLYDNIVTSDPARSGLRERRGERGLIAIGKSLSPRFTLVIRKNALFTALLPHLNDFFPCVVVVRNPLATLASWQTVDLPVHRGRVPGAEPYDRDLRRSLDREPDRLRRQVTILNWFFERYRAHLDPRHVIRYEDLIESGGRALFRRLGRDGAEPVVLESRNHNALYRGAAGEALLRALMETGGAWTHFYRPCDLEHAWDGIRRRA